MCQTEHIFSSLNLNFINAWGVIMQMENAKFGDNRDKMSLNTIKKKHDKCQTKCHTCQIKIH